MGVCGCGKTTVGELLATQTGGIFIDGDSLHPPENVAKMSTGSPLNDDDRAGWLAVIRTKAAEHPGPWPLLIACSALKRKYRDLLCQGKRGEKFYFIHLSGSTSLIKERMEKRTDHFMKAGMLKSQFSDLETLGEDEQGCTVDITSSPEEVVRKIQSSMPLIESK